MEQTEIDALATLQPGVLRQIVEDAIAPYYDRTLTRRVATAQQAWQEEANAILNAALDTDEFRDLFSEAMVHRNALRETIDKISEATDRLDLSFPEIEIPDPILGEPPSPLVASWMQLHTASRILRDRKAY